MWPAYRYGCCSADRTAAPEQVTGVTKYLELTPSLQQIIPPASSYSTDSAAELADCPAAASDLADHPAAAASDWADHPATAASDWADHPAAASDWADHPGAASDWADHPGAASDWADHPGAVSDWADHPAAASDWADHPAAASDWADHPGAASDWADYPAAMRSAQRGEAMLKPTPMSTEPSEPVVIPAAQADATVSATPSIHSKPSASARGFSEVITIPTACQDSDAIKSSQHEPIAVIPAEVSLYAAAKSDDAALLLGSECTRVHGSACIAGAPADAARAAAAALSSTGSTGLSSAAITVEMASLAAQYKLCASAMSAHTTASPDTGTASHSPAACTKHPSAQSTSLPDPSLMHTEQMAASAPQNTSSAHKALSSQATMPGCNSQPGRTIPVHPVPVDARGQSEGPLDPLRSSPSSSPRMLSKKPALLSCLDSWDEPHCPMSNSSRMQAGSQPASAPGHTALGHADASLHADTGHTDAPLLSQTSDKGVLCEASRTPAWQHVIARGSYTPVTDNLSQNADQCEPQSGATSESPPAKRMKSSVKEASCQPLTARIPAVTTPLHHAAHTLQTLAPTATSASASKLSSGNALAAAAACCVSCGSGPTPHHILVVSRAPLLPKHSGNLPHKQYCNYLLGVNIQMPSVDWMLFMRL